MAPGFVSLLRSLAACLPAVAASLHALVFGEPLGPVLRWLWAGAGLLLSLARLIDSQRAGTRPAGLNRRTQAWVALAAVGMLALGNRIYWPTRRHEQKGDALYRVTTRGRAGDFRGGYTATADQLARESEFSRANVGLAFLLFGGLLLGKASRDALAPQRNSTQSNEG